LRRITGDSRDRNAPARLSLQVDVLKLKSGAADVRDIVRADVERFTVRGERRRTNIKRIYRHNVLLAVTTTVVFGEFYLPDL
jgi:hypothetical protein